MNESKAQSTANVAQMARGDAARSHDPAETAVKDQSELSHAPALQANAALRAPAEGSKSAVCWVRAALMEPVGLHVPDVGS